jgi:hypothetical protein
MSSDIRRIVFNTRERLTSTDLNNMTALHHRALIEAAASLAMGDTTHYGVVRGLIVSVVAATLTVSVSPGLALRGATAPTTYDSTTEWIELRSAEVINLSSYVDAANPRWVVIEIANTDAVELSTGVDIYQPASDTFVSGANTKVSGSDPTITVTAGTAAATPIFPAGTAGRIPLAYVYIPALAATLDVDDVVGCRPVLRPGSPEYYLTTSQQVQGGGVWIGSNNSTTVRFDECTGYIGDSQLPFSVGRLTDSSTAEAAKAMTAADFDGNAFPAEDTPVYFYAIKPPYPSGYDVSLADREFVISSDMDTATRFGGLVDGAFKNCCVVVSTSAPLPNTITGVSLGNFTITSPPFAAGSITVSRRQAIYLGAACWRFDDSNFYGQSKYCDDIMLTNGAGAGWICSTVIHDGTNFLTGTVNIWDDGGTDVCKLPITATAVLAYISVATGTATGFSFVLEDSRPYSVLSFADNGGSGTSQNRLGWFTLYPDAAGDIEFTSGSATAADTDLGGASLTSAGYRDCILCRR